MLSMEQLVGVLTDWSAVFMRNSMRNFIRYSKESGLSMTQIGALFRIFHLGNSAISNVGEELGVTPAAASQMLERLVQQGLILRSEDPVDRRVKQIVLTDKGRKTVKEGISARQQWFFDLAEMLSEGERAQVVEALTMLIERANQLDLKNPDKIKPENLGVL
jgi:DNA-binding MarR family transcriptional regulator